jgi:RNA polymerase sigma-70 factor (ECF subfamily)
MSPDELTADQLLSRARAGDVVSLGRLLERYRAYMAILARSQIGRQLQGKFDASDVLQETFLAATVAFGQFRGRSEAELTSWLRKILGGVMANLVRHYVQTKGRDARLERALVDDLEEASRVFERVLVAAGSSPSQQAARRERAVMLADAMQRLPSDYCEVILLRHFEGLSFPQVAGRMGRTEDSVKNLWARALGKLRLALDEHQ